MDKELLIELNRIKRFYQVIDNVCVTPPPHTLCTIPSLCRTNLPFTNLLFIFNHNQCLFLQKIYHYLF
jgi:hypothetical protein